MAANRQKAPAVVAGHVVGLLAGNRHQFDRQLLQVGQRLGIAVVALVGALRLLARKPPAGGQHQS